MAQGRYWIHRINTLRLRWKFTEEVLTTTFDTTTPGGQHFLLYSYHGMGVVWGRLMIYRTRLVDSLFSFLEMYSMTLVPYLLRYKDDKPKRVEEEVRLNCRTLKVYCFGVWIWCKQYKGENRRWLRQREQRADMGGLWSWSKARFWRRFDDRASNNRWSLPLPDDFR